jgi:predicted nuclease of predicted toxin-antitoxin system
MSLRLLLDEDVHLALAATLRKRGYDAVHVGEAARFGRPDDDQLEYAANENRCLVTFNVGDFVRLHNRWLGAEREHAGIIVSKQLPTGESLRRLLTLLQHEDAASMRGQLRFL